MSENKDDLKIRWLRRDVYENGVLTETVLQVLNSQGIWVDTPFYTIEKGKDEQKEAQGSE